MRLKKLLFPLCLLPLLVSCRHVMAPRPVITEKNQPAAAPARPKLSAEDVKKIEQLYYQAVDAYTNDNVAGSDIYLKEIFKLDPSYAPAKELKEKLKLVGTPEPQKPARVSTQTVEPQ